MNNGRIKKSLKLSLIIILLGVVCAVGLIWYFSTDLPGLEELEQFEPDVVSTVYSVDGTVLTEFGIKNRTLIPLDSIPDYVKNALLSTEDRNFYNHWGMYLPRLVKAVWLNITQGFGAQGASTLTQQLARTLHLNQQETLKRKVQELFVAILIERTYSKTEILEMYLNSSFWGHGCYGIQAACDYYFSKEVQDLTLDEAAMLIGILPAPSRFTPRFYHDRAIRRRNIILRNMVKTGKITQQAFMDALAEKTPVRHVEIQSNAPYFTEYVRLEVASFCRQHGINYYRDGLKIYTTLDSKMQTFAREAINKKLESQQKVLNKSLLDNPEFLLKVYNSYFPNRPIPLTFYSSSMIIAARPNKSFPLTQDKPISYSYFNKKYISTELTDSTTGADSLLSDPFLMELAPIQGELRTIIPGSPVDSSDISIIYPIESYNYSPLAAEYSPYLYDTLYQDTLLYNAFLTDSLGRDSLTFDSETWYTIVVDSSSIILDSLLSALPLKAKTVQASMMSLDPESGAIKVMIGGRNFEESKFNRAVQAKRQPGSTFKPFVYTAVIDNGYAPCTQLLNQPPAIPQTEGKLWIPKNFDNSTGGLMTLREGLRGSVNLIAANAIIQLTTPEVVINYARNMGITTRLPAYPSLALGSGEVLLYDMVSAYSIFANQGIWNKPYAITKIQDRNGREIYRSPRATKEVLSKATTYIMVDMMKSVIREGTGKSLARTYGWKYPTGGKTGTTNNYTDAWFIGYTPELVAGVWVGVDDSRIPLGTKQSGSKAALPIWANFMTKTYDSLAIPVEDFIQPPTVRRFKICKTSKKIPTEFCPTEYELFNVRYAPQEQCDIHGLNIKESSTGIDF